MLHADAGGAVAAHGMADQAAAFTAGNGAIVGIHIGHQVTGDEVLEIPGGDRRGIHRTVMHRLGIRQHHDHVFRALAIGTGDGLGHMNFLAPLLRADRIAVQRIDHRIATRRIGGIAGWQEHQHITVGGIAFQAAFQRRTMHLDVFYRHLRRAGNQIGDIVLGLGKGRARQQGQQTNRQQGRPTTRHANLPKPLLSALRRLLLSEFIPALPVGKRQLLRQCSSTRHTERALGGSDARQGLALAD